MLILDHASVPSASMTPEVLMQRFPHLVTVSLTAFGLTGEYGGAVGDSLLAEAYGGLANMIGEPDQRPLSLGGEQSAHAAAFVGLYGAMVALRSGAETGRGEYVEVAQSDVAAYIDWKSDVSYSLGDATPVRTGSSRGGWRVIQARDGWIGVIFLAHQWSMLVELIGDPRLMDPCLGDVHQREEQSEAWWAVIAEVIGQRDAEEVYASAQRLGLSFGFAADAADLLSCEQLLGRGFVLPAERRRRDAPVVCLPVAVPGMRDPCAPAPKLGKHADAATAWASASTQGQTRPGRSAADGPELDSASPLGGLLVLDFGAITAGAATGRLLADYGATVIKIESHSRPDPFRHWVSPNGRAPGDGAGPTTSPVFSSNNVGKRGLCLDLKTERGRQIVHRLIQRADVLVENFRAGVTSRMGIDYETVHRLNPDLVYLSLSSQGLSGIESSYSSYGSTLDLLSGLAAVTGYPGGSPLRSSGEVNYPDQVVSLLGAALVMHAVVVGQGGVHLDVSQREVVAWTLADQLAEFAWTGHSGRPNGNRRPGSTPHDTYPAMETEAWLAIACTTDGHRRALARPGRRTPGRCAGKMVDGQPGQRRRMHRRLDTGAQPESSRGGVKRRRRSRGSCIDCGGSRRTVALPGASDGAENARMAQGFPHDPARLRPADTRTRPGTRRRHTELERRRGRCVPGAHRFNEVRRVMSRDVHCSFNQKSSAHRPPMRLVRPIQEIET
ncbi:CoA transferase [Variovorax sp. J31P207]|nr:CoA transferase [Variovorax sp. J31P207]MDM0072668.1 CoA transferase [Variovorax sp. J31P207]